ncbi:MinD/ParA family protein [Halorubrum sp. SD690R]|uniref:MinD/ParA family ATP-binding protein n=1 Tax=Halorubrum sp. SD690R TaxID=2518117 RepID=UPI0010F65AF9|nr:MinD/ParA family protein [Halorubrum sp. SD690R]TKX47234.1 MinD/ParA family protein [Halorubrum sp. SD690R]
MNQTVAVTSGTRGTAKSTSSVALGRLLANAGHDVLLVDCDFDDPSLADRLDIEDSAVTIQDVFVGDAAISDAIHETSDGVSVVPASASEVPDPALIATYIRALDDFDVVICDTGHPFSDATTGALDAADGVLVVSTPDAAARRNTAILHEALRDRGGPPMVGTVLTRVCEESPPADWDCDLLTSIPDSDALLTGTRALCGSRDPASVAYRELAAEVHRWLESDAGDDPGPIDRNIWLPPPADSFVTPGASPSAGGDRESNVSAVSDGGDRSSTAASSETTATDDATPSAPDTESSDSTTDHEDDDEGLVITRRGALTAAAAAAVGGVSAGILSGREAPDFDSFGYGGVPVSSNESSTAATNDTTTAGSPPATGFDRSDLTTETEGTGDTGERSENQTDTNTGNGTETGEDLNRDAGSETGEQTDPDADSGGDTTTDTGGGSETGTGGTGSGGSDGGTGDSSGGDGSENTGGGSESGDGTDDGSESGDGTDDGSESGDGTDDGSESGDGTDDGSESGDGSGGGTAPPGEDEPYGTVGYGQGGYGGVV